eukprot:TRINITY_DN781_c0_g1_i1.p1 TRINITY_DN781_c0_g1~~TRINITY_DN781_c0_g1_i1.p1  ORF type:complete len:344 (+),score=68.21 TRINITY_DN781_c0_g1_i1:71-1102(+)
MATTLPLSQEFTNCLQTLVSLSKELETNLRTDMFPSNLMKEIETTTRWVFAQATPSMAKLIADVIEQKILYEPALSTQLVLLQLVDSLCQIQSPSINFSSLVEHRLYKWVTHIVPRQSDSGNSERIPLVRDRLVTWLEKGLFKRSTSIKNALKYLDDYQASSSSSSHHNKDKSSSAAMQTPLKQRPSRQSRQPSTLPDSLVNLSSSSTASASTSAVSISMTTSIPVVAPITMNAPSDSALDTIPHLDEMDSEDREVEQNSIEKKRSEAKKQRLENALRRTDEEREDPILCEFAQAWLSSFGRFTSSGEDFFQFWNQSASNSCGSSSSSIRHSDTSTSMSCSKT